MKKLFLLTTLFFQLTFVFGQKSDWGPWTSISCFQGIQYSIKNLGYEKSTKNYWWNIRWKNNYSKAVSFDGVVIIDGESSIRGGWGNIQAGEIQTYTSVPYKSSSIHFTVSVSKVCFADRYGGCSETLEGWANYAECDNGTPNYKINGKRTTNSNNNSTNQTNTESNMDDINEEIKDLQSRQSLACAKLQQQGNPFDNRLCSEGFNGALPQNDADTKKWVIQLRSQVKELESKLNITKNITDEKENAQKEEELKRQKLAEENNTNYEKYIQAGDNDMISNNYSSAMSNYQSAMSYASNSNQKSTAQEKYNKALKEKEAVDRKIRTDKVKEKDKNENMAYASATAGMIGLMALINDETSSNFISGRLQLGLGMDNIPLITNSISSNTRNKSYLQSSLHPTFYFGFNIGIAETKQIYGNINPFFTAGLNALSAGTTGGHITYGGLVDINVKPIKNSIFGAYIDGGWIWKSGHLDFDYDAVQNNTTQTDDVRSGDYSYKTIRYGGGLMLHNVDESDYWYVKFGTYWDRADFMGSNNASILNFSLQALDSYIGKFEFIYSPNSYVGGIALYPSNLSKENLDFFMIRFVRQGKLW